MAEIWKKQAYQKFNILNHKLQAHSWEPQVCEDNKVELGEKMTSCFTVKGLTLKAVEEQWRYGFNWFHYNDSLWYNSTSTVLSN